MYVVGFYSPKKQAGVTKMALEIYKKLQSYESLSIGFVSNHRLEVEPITDHTSHLFADLSLSEQKKKINMLKKEFDIIIYDASSGLSETTLNLLPVVDRLFILGEDDTFFAQTLFSVITFNRSFERHSKDLVNQLHNDGNYVLHNSAERKLGFTKSSQNVSQVCDLIYHDYSLYFLHNHYVQQSEKVIAKLKKIKPENFTKEAYKLGFSFEKAVLFQRFVKLRTLLGQSYGKALDTLFPFFAKHTYAESLAKFEQELRVAQIHFESHEADQGE